jgi:hypothetical protein
MAQQMSEKALTKVARRDVGRRFVLTTAEYKLYKKDKRNNTSDLFKPNPRTVSDTTLLADSVYVKAYRSFAYIKTQGKADSDLIVWLGGGIIVAGVTYIALVIIGIANIDLNVPM